MYSPNPKKKKITLYGKQLKMPTPGPKCLCEIAHLLIISDIHNFEVFSNLGMKTGKELLSKPDCMRIIWTQKRIMSLNSV